MSIKDNLERIQSSFVNPDCQLVSVSKTKPLELLMEAYEAGVRDFGENKVQELQWKQPEMPSDVRWHMIGHLQRNKVKYIAPYVALIHGVDSERLLKEINKQGTKVDRKIPVLLQMHIAEEESKFGFDRDEVLSLLKSDEFSEFQNIEVKGLMGMATNTSDQDQIRKEFKGLKSLFEEIKALGNPQLSSFEELSMGMSGDYTIAQEEGSTMVRIGSAIFGPRNYPKKNST